MGRNIYDFYTSSEKMPRIYLLLVITTVAGIMEGLGLVL